MKKHCNVATKPIKLIDGINITVDEARVIILKLKAQIKDHAWSATAAHSVAHVNVAKQMFDSANDGSVFTVHITDENELFEIKRALSVDSRSIVPVIGALMEFHKDNESLNILISDAVMGDSAYKRYTGQFAQQVAKTTQEFLKVRCIYDTFLATMGIFCRKTEFDISVTFKGQLVATLQSKGEATFNRIDIPETYLDYPSMLLYSIRKKLPGYSITLKKTKTSYKFSAEKMQKTI